MPSNWYLYLKSYNQFDISNKIKSNLDDFMLLLWQLHFPRMVFLSFKHYFSPTKVFICRNFSFFYIVCFQRNWRGQSIFQSDNKFVRGYNLKYKVFKSQRSKLVKVKINVLFVCSRLCVASPNFLFARP